MPLLSLFAASDFLYALFFFIFSLLLLLLLSKSSCVLCVGMRIGVRVCVRLTLRCVYYTCVRPSLEIAKLLADP